MDPTLNVITLFVELCLKRFFCAIARFPSLQVICPKSVQKVPFLCMQKKKNSFWRNESEKYPLKNPKIIVDQTFNAQLWNKITHYSYIIEYTNRKNMRLQHVYCLQLFYVSELFLTCRTYIIHIKQVSIQAQQTELLNISSESICK